MVVMAVLILAVIIAMMVGAVIVIDGFWGVGAVGNCNASIAVVGLGTRIVDLGVSIGIGIAIDVNLEILVGHIQRYGTTVCYGASKCVMESE